MLFGTWERPRKLELFLEASSRGWGVGRIWITQILSYMLYTWKIDFHRCLFYFNIYWFLYQVCKIILFIIYFDVWLGLVLLHFEIHFNYCLLFWIFFFEKIYLTFPFEQPLLPFIVNLNKKKFALLKMSKLLILFELGCFF